jgi:ribosomal protein S18 acetylase RimI-like enzyme
LGVTTPAIRKADRADVSALASALARAFDDDPVMAWLFPDPAGRKRTLPRFFSAHLTKIVLPHGEVYTTGDVAGGALWEPPGKWRLGMRGQLRMLPNFIRLFGRRLGVASRGLNLVEALHPQEPHWYLAVLGTDPARQGHGIGSALMIPVLEHCDREGMPAYLESSKESNIAFYSRHGFKVTGEIRLPGGPLVWPMWRPSA